MSSCSLSAAFRPSGRLPNSVSKPTWVAVADETLLPMMMYQSNMPNGKPYAGWDIESNTNQLVLAYTSTSKYAAELNSNNWYQIISRPDVAFGLTDPRIDAVGYRTLMLLGLAASYYNDPTLIQDGSGQPFLDADYR